MSRYQRIYDLIQNNLKPVHFELENESHTHSVPENSETHFRLFLVSNEFVGQTRVQRQQMVNELLKTEFQNGLHAFTQRLLTENEYQTQAGQNEFVSPACHGGSRTK